MFKCHSRHLHRSERYNTGLTGDCHASGARVEGQKVYPSHLNSNTKCLHLHKCILPIADYTGRYRILLGRTVTPR